MSSAEETLAGLKLGPEGYTRIAVMGTAPSSVELAPFDDPSWAIWGCSPGLYPICAKKRSDVWFEPHRWLPTPPGQFGKAGTRPWFSPEFHEFLAQHKGPVFMSKAEPLIPSSVRIPYEYLIEKYGPYFFTSTVAYMLVMAIEVLAPRVAAGEKVMLGLFGVDMAAGEEWAYQRPGCQHFVGLAMAMGINVLLPEESDLMRPPTMYGIGEHNPRHIRLLARLADCNAQKQQIDAQIPQLQHRSAHLQGLIDQLQYDLAVWTDDIEYDPKHAVSFAAEFQKKPGTLAEARKQAESSGAAVIELPATGT